MSGQGDFVLAELFAQHHVPYCRWQSLSADRQQALLKAFLTDDGHKINPKQALVTSTEVQSLSCSRGLLWGTCSKLHNISKEKFTPLNQ